MAEENADDLPIADQGSREKKQNPIIVLAVVLATAIAVAAALTMFLVLPMIGKQKNEEAGGVGSTKEQDALHHMENRQQVSFEGLTTNLQDREARYIRVSFTLEGSHPEFTKTLEAHKPKVLDAAISVLQTISMEDINRGGIKNIVSSQLAHQVNMLLEPLPHMIEHVYFSEFLVQ